MQNRLIGLHWFDDVQEKVETLAHDKSVKEQLGIDVKKRNREIVRAMELSNIEGTDLEKFLSLVEIRCQQL